MVLFVIVLLKVLVLCSVVLSPVVLALSVAIHVNVEDTLLVNGMLTVPPLHIVAELALVIAGVGFTVTLTVCPAPMQLPPIEVGVTV